MSDLKKNAAPKKTIWLEICSVEEDNLVLGGQSGWRRTLVDDLIFNDWVDDLVFSNKEEHEQTRIDSRKKKGK